MRTLSILTAAGILVAISAPSLAASRTQAHRSFDARASYAQDQDNAFWAPPYAYAPHAPGPRGSTYGVQERNSFGPAYNSFGPGNNVPQRGIVGTIRNDW
jgi:hypothetical protein